ncbi:MULTISPECIES: DL-endopeptidase inhibitor IseA family protein [unclassified Paenibacillus]|uniref:DL-endopeptidase inhibitor IseA family protein n=1 Tax=unclassified Paenibacillus TaxID=185978 RepID=UPI001B7A88FF|nr:hypothetical protein [Paenibacillus sp. PvP091]MBP1169165.1 hypothetical protein [Paenibacillus sp. PvR098]MBP2440193.1 hypothetical protein [Paenibacillus sp. PvP052]
MKMNGKSFVSGVVLGSVLFSGISLAAPKVVKLMVNGSEIHSEVPAQIIDGSTLIPVRALSEALGAEVIWDEANQTVIVENEKYRQLQRKNLEISDRDAVGLVGDAQKHFWFISRGGEGERIDGSFGVEGKEYPYRWMSSDLDTKDKFIAYVERVYTPEQAAAYWKKQTENGSILEIEGKLAQPEADGGSALEWSNASAKLIQEGKGTKTYRFQVPIFDEFEEREVKLRYVEGKGWRIDEPADTVR